MNIVYEYEDIDLKIEYLASMFSILILNCHNDGIIDF